MLGLGYLLWTMDDRRRTMDDRPALPCVRYDLWLVWSLETFVHSRTGMFKEWLCHPLNSTAYESLKASGRYQR
jgi:hypothetical protein